MDYPVLFGGRNAGKVQLLREGLYWRIVCRCQLTGEVVCRLVAMRDGQRENIGILVPAGDGFGLDKRIPVKRLDPEGTEFQLIPSCGEKPGERFVPIRPEEPFAYIEDLKGAYLARRNGSLGIMLRE